MNYSKIFYSVLLPCLFACQTPPYQLEKQSSNPQILFLDSAFEPSNENMISIESEVDIFLLDDEMKAVVDNKLRNRHSYQHKARILLDHLFSVENLSLQYEGNANIVAREAFHSKTANCMSLTIMAYALAKEAGMHVQFQQVNVPEYWQRDNSYSFLTGHVNLRITNKPNSESVYTWGDNGIQIDFDPYIAKQRFSIKKISKKTVVAMFYNNKGSDALIRKNYDLAYQYFKAAIKQDPNFSPAWGNLGILYRLNNHYQVAEKTYRYALTINDKNLTVLNNLALLMEIQGRVTESQPIRNYLQQLRQSNPYYHALLADEAFDAGDFITAEKLYKSAIDLYPQGYEFYHGLAKAYYKQGKVNLSKRAMRKAISYNYDKTIQRLYVAKLHFLNDIE
ncbi:hypothetical protein GCM10009111_21140 [Colwellia asteriadis]|uniref:Tetratricopeptide repeat protein n=1 Tax=Colwellia asteriadis TaxID=517723 RepID=A0ABP3WKG6_9GAMM